MEPQTLEHIEGTIEDIVYHNEETTFTVLEVSVEDLRRGELYRPPQVRPAV